MVKCQRDGRAAGPSSHRGSRQTSSEYLARALLESSEQRGHRYRVKPAAREHHHRLVKDFEKASDYHETARELAAETRGREPSFTEKERINLESMPSGRTKRPKEKD